jgi:hypothetical protein
MSLTKRTPEHSRSYVLATAAEAVAVEEAAPIPARRRLCPCPRLRRLFPRWLQRLPRLQQKLPRLQQKLRRLRRGLVGRLRRLWRWRLLVLVASLRLDLVLLT